MVFSTKETFDGDWANDLPRTNGNRFIYVHYLLIRNFIPDGQGVMEYPSGDRYEGGWKAGQRSGHVRTPPQLLLLRLSYSPNTPFRVYSDMQIAMFMTVTGSITSYLAPPFHFISSQGIVSLSKVVPVIMQPSVRGTLTCANGLYYDGEWHLGEFHGHGLCTSPTGKVYDGHWSHGQRSGTGVLRHYLNNVQSCLVEEYEGEWLEDMVR